MSFLQKAREAASNAADSARQAAEQARLKASDPATQERFRQSMQQTGAAAREAGSAAKRGLTKMVDPGMLADLVIKATALQERTNAALRTKGSPYRIAEVTITASLPPQIGFSIARVGDIEETLTGQEIDSAELVTEVLAEEATDGTAGELALGDGALTGLEFANEDAPSPDAVPSEQRHPLGP